MGQEGGGTISYYESTHPADLRPELEFCERGLTLDGWLTVGYNHELLELEDVTRAEGEVDFTELRFRQRTDVYLEEEQHIVLINTLDERPFFLTTFAEAGTVTIFLPDSEDDGQVQNSYVYAEGKVARFYMAKYNPEEGDFLYFFGDRDPNGSPRFALRYNSYVIEPEIGEDGVLIVRVGPYLGEDGDQIPHPFFGLTDDEIDG